jgi:hypothetical protein
MHTSVRLLRALRLFLAHEGRGIDELGRVSSVAIHVHFKNGAAVVEMKPTIEGHVDLTEDMRSIA